MIFNVQFTGGPLDGMIMEGSDEKPPAKWEDLAGIIYRTTKGGLTGATFEVFDPQLLFEEPVSRLLRLHLYRVDARRDRYKGSCTRLYISYVGPSHRAIGTNADALRRWADDCP